MLTTLLSENITLSVHSSTLRQTEHRIEVRKDGLLHLRVLVDVLFTGDVILSVSISDFDIKRTKVFTSEKEAVKFAATLIAKEILHD